MFLCILLIMPLINKMNFMLKTQILNKIIMEINKAQNLYYKEYRMMEEIQGKFYKKYKIFVLKQYL